MEVKAATTQATSWGWKHPWRVSFCRPASRRPCPSGTSHRDRAVAIVSFPSTSSRSAGGSSAGARPETPRRSLSERHVRVHANEYKSCMAMAWSYTLKSPKFGPHHELRHLNANVFNPTHLVMMTGDACCSRAASAAAPCCMARSNLSTFDA
jgi:hypothetical protein